MTELSDSPTTDLTGAAADALASLAEVPVTVPLDPADFLAQATAELPVGSLNTSQVTGLLAQTRLQVDQGFDIVSLDKGIGQYGLSAGQLESAGFLKPGTVQTYLKDPAALESVLSSPSVWTGKSGVDSLNGLLSDPDLQSLTQNEIMVSSLEGLRSAGVVTGDEQPEQLASILQTASRFGVSTTVDWVNGAAAPDMTTEINSVAKNAQFAVNFVDTKASELVTGGLKLGGFTGTVERGAIDQAVTQVIGNPKVPVPNFSTGLFSNVPTADLDYTGDDPIVLARINAERERRGLPPLQQ